MEDQVEANEDNFQINPANMPGARQAQWKGIIEQQLQVSVQNASDIREKINTAKTRYKKEYYAKKFHKIQSQVIQMVSALQQIRTQEEATPTPDPVPNFDHRGEDQSNEDESIQAT